MSNKSGWLTDFAWEQGAVRIRKTDIRLPFSYSLFAEIASWAIWLPILGVAGLLARRRPGPAIWFAPDVPRPWYLIRAAAIWSGCRLARTPEEADATVYFHDITAEPPLQPPVQPALNFACADVSKSRVAAVFEQVFGYPLAVDPRAAVGRLVEKPETNGVHGGRIIQGPTEPKAGFVYQHLIETRDAAGDYHDLRSPTVGGRPVVVWEKHKRGDSFAIHSRRTLLREPEAVYSPAELRLIAEFCFRMGLDWGGLDILRDRRDGRIYIVDVNKTDLGPVISLGWSDKARSVGRLGQALTGMIEARRRLPVAEDASHAA